MDESDVLKAANGQNEKNHNLGYTFFNSKSTDLLLYCGILNQN